MQITIKGDINGKTDPMERLTKGLNTEIANLKKNLAEITQKVKKHINNFINKLRPVSIRENNSSHIRLRNPSASYLTESK